MCSILEAKVSLKTLLCDYSVQLLTTTVTALEKSIFHSKHLLISMWDYSIISVATTTPLAQSLQMHFWWKLFLWHSDITCALPSLIWGLANKGTHISRKAVWKNKGLCLPTDLSTEPVWPCPQQARTASFPGAGRGIIPLDCCATTCSLCLWLNSRPLEKYLKKTCPSVFSLRESKASSFQQGFRFFTKSPVTPAEVDNRHSRSLLKRSPGQKTHQIAPFHLLQRRSY